MRRERIKVIENIEGSAVLAASPGKTHHVWIMQGQATFMKGNESAVRLSRGETADFPADVQMQCLGEFKACVLTVDEKSRVVMDYLEIGKDNKVYPIFDTADYAELSQIFYVAEGYAVLNLPSGTEMLEVDQQFFYDDDVELQKQAGIMGEGIVIRMQVLSGKGRSVAEVKKEKKLKAAPTLKDFGLSVLISMTNFRLADRLSPFKKNNWLDEEITEVLHKVRRRHVTIIIWILALCTILAIGMTIEGFTFLALVLSVVGWSVFQVCILLPVIYTIMLPRPVKDHVKNVNTLSEEEWKLRQTELEEVRRKKHALKRY